MPRMSISRVFGNVDLTHDSTCSCVSNDAARDGIASPPFWISAVATVISSSGFAGNVGGFDVGAGFVLGAAGFGFGGRHLEINRARSPAEDVPISDSFPPDYAGVVPFCGQPTWAPVGPTVIVT